ncbi:hypothetical protein PM082_005487 [Marasmius tenuissimus]|nr:hypothetical protein PM082_005487 [Marasmius tenuissimus]
MSLSLPIEDLSRLKVTAHLSPSGQPVLSLTLRATPPSPPSIPPSSGIYVSFERSMENGCWSLVMNTTMHTNNDLGKSDPGMFSSSPSGTSETLLNSSNQSTVSTTAIPNLAESPLLGVGELGRKPSLEASSLLAWLHSQKEIASVDNTDIDLSFGFNAPLSLNSGSVQSSPIPAAGSSYDMLFPGVIPGVFPSQVPQVPDFNTLQPPSTPPSSSDHCQDDEESDASSSLMSERQERGNKRKRRNLPCLEPTCSRHFMNEHTREKHMQTHRDKPRRSFPCTMGCSEQFSRQHDRFRHEVAKHGYQSEWTCDECHGFFSSEKSRSSHKCTKGGRWKISVPKS